MVDAPARLFPARLVLAAPPPAPAAPDRPWNEVDTVQLSPDAPRAQRRRAERFARKHGRPAVNMAGAG